MVAIRCKRVVGAVNGQKMTFRGLKELRSKIMLPIRSVLQMESMLGCFSQGFASSTQKMTSIWAPATLMTFDLERLHLTNC